MIQKEFNFEYKKTARRHGLFYILVPAGILFIFLAVRATETALWLKLFAGLIGGLFALGGIAAISRNWHWGSRIDFEKSQLIWWESYPPVSENKISISDIDTIVMENSTGDSRVYLLDSKNQKIKFTEECIPGPAIEWTSALKEKFPHIKIVAK